MTTQMNIPAGEIDRPKSKSFTRFIPHIVRVLMALLFCFAGSNGFFHYVPTPPDVPEFATALMKTGYMLQMIAGTQLLCGVLLLINRFVPLALVLIAPVAVNILAFHIFLDRKGLPVAIVLTAMEIYLAWSYRAAYRPMFAMRATPGKE